MTRNEIINLKVGDFIQQTFDVKAFTKLRVLKDNPVWGRPRRITCIRLRGIDREGNAFIQGFVESPTGNGEISFTTGEGEADYRLGSFSSP